MSNHNVLCGHLEYALDDSPKVYCASERRTQFDFVGRRNIPADAPVIYVDSARYTRDPLEVLGRPCFVDERIDVLRAGRSVQGVRVWSCPNESTAPHREQARR